MQKSSKLAMLAASLGAMASLGAINPPAPGLELSAKPGSNADRQDPARKNKPTAGTEQRAMVRSMFGTGLGQRQRKPGPGWTQAVVQRMARKKRNQARNRRAQAR